MNDCSISSLLVKDAASVDDDHCSSRKFTDKCLKIQDGLPCSSLLGGKVDRSFIKHLFSLTFFRTSVAI